MILATRFPSAIAFYILYLFPVPYILASVLLCMQCFYGQEGHFDLTYLEMKLYPV